MNIRFKSIDIENFRSIDKARVDLENQGTVIVKGVNEYESKATSNGSGKSSIFEAIIYSIFEETSSGEKDVANRIINDGFTLTLKFDIDNNSYVIIRSSKGSGKSNVSFYKNDVDISARNKTDTNKLIISTLGINKNLFLDSVFLSQSVSTNLATLSPTARKERLEILTNTDSIISEFKDKLKEKQINYESLCVESTMNINKLNGNKEALFKQINDIDTKINEIDEQIRQRDLLGNLETIENEIQTAEKNLEIQTSDLQSKEQEILDKDKEIEQFRLDGDSDVQLKEELTNKLNEKRQEYNNISNKINMLNMDINNYKLDINRLEKEIDKIKNSDKCPTCGRKYENANEEHIQNTISDINGQIELNKNNITLKESEINEIQNTIDELAVEGKKLSEEVDTITNKVLEHKQQLTEILNKKQYLVNTKTMIQNNITALQNNINILRNRKDQILQFKVGNKDEFISMLDKVNQDVINIDEQIELHQKEYDKNNDYVTAIKHCLQLVTKEFRTYLLRNSIDYLNQLLYKYSLELFSNEGDLIQISNDDSKLDIMLGNATYESLSGGEKTRVNIALLLAQKSLASIIGNISCNIIILDEILGYCDSQAELNVIDLITKELESLESIYMVSHKEIPIGYDTELTVVKSINGLSHIKVH